MNKTVSLIVWSTAELLSIGQLGGMGALADDELVGTWKPISLVREDYPTGKITNIPLANMPGVSVFTPQGRYLFALATEQGAASRGKVNQFGAHEDLIAYTGQYRVSGDKLIQQIDLGSSTAISSGTQKQFIGWAGDQLVLESMPMRASVNGSSEAWTLTLERQ